MITRMTMNDRSGLGGLARMLAPTAMALLWAGLALAAEGESHGNPWLSLLWKTINFAVLVGVIYYFARKPVREFLNTTAQTLKVTLKQARDVKGAAEADLAEQRRKIEGLEAELGRMIKQAREDSEQEKVILLEEARAHAGRIRTQMHHQIEQEFSKATTDLKRQIADEMVRIAEGLVEKRLDDPTHDKLVSDYIQQLEDRR